MATSESAVIASEPSGAAVARPRDSTATGDRSRQLIVRLVLLVYVLLIFEGSIRKWLLPHYSHLLFFVRDPIVIGVYVVALLRGYWPRSTPLLSAGIGLAALGLILVALQVAASTAGVQDKQLLLAVYGLRNYFLYLPLPFVIAETFQPADLQRVVRFTLLISVPIALLVAVQFYSPGNSPINVGLADDIAEQFHGLGINATRTRPMGPFSSDIGQKEFAVSCLAILMSLWIVPAARRIAKRPVLVAATAATFTCLAFSGSRGAMMQSGTVVAAAVACGVVLRGGVMKVRAALIPAVIGLAAVVLYPVVFAEGYGAFVDRWNAAAAVEQSQFHWGIIGRGLLNFTNFIDLMADTPIIGYGLGLAGNASISLGIMIKGFSGWTETDWARHIVDLGPIAGLFFIAYRIAWTVWLGNEALRGTRRTLSPLPLLLFAFVALDLLAGQTTGHGSVNGYVWLFTGFCLAASRERLATGAAGSTPRQSPSRFSNLCR